MTDQDHQIRALKRKVARLEHEVHSLETERDTLLREAESRDAAAARQSHSLVGRLILVALTAAAGSAAYFMFRDEDFSMRELAALGNEVAAMNTDPWLLTCVLLIGAATIFYVSHLRLLFGFAAVVALYGTHWAYFADQPDALNLSEAQYFWISTLLLTGAYSLLAYLSVSECQRTGRGRRRWAFFALINSIAFFATLWLSIEAVQPDWAWMLRLGFAAVLAAMAVLAETKGPYRNPVFQIYVAMAVFMANLAVATLLEPTWFGTVLASECLLLAITARQTGFILFKVINTCVLIAAVVYGLRFGSPEATGDLPAWAFGLVHTAMLLGTAVLYTHDMPERTASSRKTSGHWSLADTFWDMAPSRLAGMHAIGAAPVIVASTIPDFLETPWLPYVLAAASVALLVIGFISKTSTIEFAGMLTLSAAQAAFGYAWLMNAEPTLEPALALVCTALLAFVSLAAAWRWDQTVRSDDRGGPFDHAAGMAAPYVAAGLVLAAFSVDLFGTTIAGLVQQASAIAIVLLFRTWRAGGMRMLSLTLMIAGAVTFGHAHAWPMLTGEIDNLFWAWCFGAAIAPLIAERILAYQFGTNERPGADAARTVFIVTACFTGLAGIYCGANEPARAWLWLALAAFAAVGGIAFREGRYRWAAMIVLVAASVLVAGGQADGAPAVNPYPFAAAAIAVSAVLAISWGAAVRGQWTQPRQQDHG